MRKGLRLRTGAAPCRCVQSTVISGFDGVAGSMRQLAEAPAKPARAVHLGLSARFRNVALSHSIGAERLGRSCAEHPRYRANSLLDCSRLAHAAGPFIAPNWRRPIAIAKRCSGCRLPPGRQVWTKRPK